MRESSSARITALAVSALVTFCAQRVAAASPDALTLTRELDVPFKTIKVRKIARKVLGVGAVAHDNEPLRFGPLRAVLMWRLAWRWNEGRESTLPHGLRGGPVISFDLPVQSWVSLETQFCSLRYVYARSQGDRAAMEELADPKDERRSLEAGLFANIHFDGLL
jgi:hypothetical protein